MRSRSIWQEVTAPTQTCVRSPGTIPRLKQASPNWKTSKGDGRVVGGKLIIVCCWGISLRARSSDWAFPLLVVKT